MHWCCFLSAQAGAVRLVLCPVSFTAGRAFEPSLGLLGRCSGRSSVPCRDERIPLPCFPLLGSSLPADEELSLRPCAAPGSRRRCQRCCFGGEEWNNLLCVVSLAGDKRQQWVVGNVNWMNILQSLDTALALIDTAQPCPGTWHRVPAACPGVQPGTGCGCTAWHRRIHLVCRHKFFFLYLFPFFPSCKQMKHALNFQESDCCGSSCGKSNAQQAPIIHNNFV